MHCKCPLLGVKRTCRFALQMSCLLTQSGHASLDQAGSTRGGTSASVIFIGAKGGVVAVILLVEDEDQVRVLSESFLQTAGHTTLSAGSIEQALALLSSPEPIDLLFIDLNLKGESEAGLSLAVQAVETRPELKVLYTSGQAVTDGMMALFVKNSAFLPKPYTVEQLGTMLSMKFDFRSSARPHAGDGTDGAQRL